ncbi:MAG TPA: hypothetical protein VF364_12520 [Candidatus Limnocylindria bacterium]|jgi:hypothetical protein
MESDRAADRVHARGDRAMPDKGPGSKSKGKKEKGGGKKKK